MDSHVSIILQMTINIWSIHITKLKEKAYSSSEAKERWGRHMIITANHEQQLKIIFT